MKPSRARPGSRADYALSSFLALFSFLLLAAGARAQTRSIGPIAITVSSLEASESSTIQPVRSGIVGLPTVVDVRLVVVRCIG